MACSAALAEVASSLAASQLTPEASPLGGARFLPGSCPRGSSSHQREAHQSSVTFSTQLRRDVKLSERPISGFKQISFTRYNPSVPQIVTSFKGECRTCAVYRGAIEHKFSVRRHWEKLRERAARSDPFSRVHVLWCQAPPMCEHCREREF